MARLRMEGPLSLVAMDCYEEMFKDITKKLYGDDGLGDIVETPGPGGPEARPAISTYDDTGGTFRDEPLPIGGGLALLSNGLGSTVASAAQNNGENTSNTTTGSSSRSREKAQSSQNAAQQSNGEDKWYESDEVLGWTNSKVASYNPAQKLFRCVDCDCVGFLSRVAEHWLGTHANLRVFQCPRCPYTSAWARCVRMHLTRQHNEQYVDGNLWKENPVLEEVTKFMQNLKTVVESKVESQPVNIDKRYCCPFCPYATDRRDLFNRHENIHRDEKPFQCYICDKQFNRADHVKKHFLRMHRDVPYDIARVRKQSNKSSVPYYPKYPVPSQSQPQATQQTQPQQQSQQQQLTDGSTTIQPLDFYSGNTKLHIKHPLPPPPAPIIPQQIPERPQIPPIIPHAPITPPLNMVAPTPRGKSSSKKKKVGDKMYSCTYCPWQGVDNWCLKRHLNTHIKPFLCALCEYKAARSERLATHVLKVHSKRVCSKCSFLADDLASLTQHLQEHHQNPNIKSGFSCSICSEYFEVRADLEAHSILEHNKLIVQCDLCDFRTTDEISMEEHLREKHNIPEVKEFMEDDSEYFCSECGCEFSNESSLIIHDQVFHKAEKVKAKAPYECRLCPFVCSYQRTMTEHMRLHTGNILICQAESCDFDTPFDLIMKKHVFNQHMQNNNSLIARCLHCGLTTPTCYAFTHHWRQHHHDLCTLCIYIYKKYFGMADSVVKTLQKSNGTQHSLIGSNSSPNEHDSIDSNGKRSRKQSCPRKLVVMPDTTEIRVVPKIVKARKHKRNVLLELTEKYVSFEIKNGARCYNCRMNVNYSNKSNLLLHSVWHHWYDKYQCNQCHRKFRHKYQILLHSRTDHNELNKENLSK